jgi:AGCS family alanine or glycine:cation symporter
MYLMGNSTKALPLFRLCVLGMVMFGAVAKISLVWNLADVSMGLMATVNIVALLLLSGLAIRVINDYREQINAGKTPEFDRSKFPELMDQLDDDIWQDTSLVPAKKL